MGMMSCSISWKVCLVPCDEYEVFFVEVGEWMPDCPSPLRMETVVLFIAANVRRYHL